MKCSYAEDVARLNETPFLPLSPLLRSMEAGLAFTGRPLKWNLITLQVFNPSPVPLGKGASQLLVWSKWNIIFSYTSYFTGSLTDAQFMQLAADVVQSGLAVVSHLSRGFLIWKSDTVHAEPFGISTEPYVMSDTASFMFPDGLDPYQMQCALHAAQQDFFEQHASSPMALQEREYFRAFLDRCELIFDDVVIALYPSVTVHRNGVFQTQFRMLAPSHQVSTQELIDRYLNAPMLAARDILLPPALMRLDARKVLFEDEDLGNRAATLKQWSKFLSLLDRSLIRSEGGDDSFDHDLVSIDPEGAMRGPAASLTLLMMMVGNSLETLLNRPRMGWKYRLLGPRDARFQQGMLWSGRPNVYLLTMGGHPETADGVLARYGTDFGRIMARSSAVSQKMASNWLGSSLRAFDDYLAFIGDAVNLYAFSRNGVNDSWGSDPNGSELIYRLQAHVDLVDFINGSLWQCEERALMHGRTVEDLIANRERQTVYEHISRHPFVNGELNAWFTAAQKAVNMDAVRAAIAFNTTINLEKFKERRNFNRQQFQWFMAALLGVIAAGTSGGKLASLFWEGVGFQPLTELGYALLAMAVVVVLFGFSYRVFVEPVKVSR